MKLLYGTKNPAKLEAMRKRLRELDIEVIGFCSPEIKKLCETIPDVPEEGNTPLENARQKAQAYYEIFKMYCTYDRDNWRYKLGINRIF